ncbi:MAG: peptide deformylase [Bacteroidota bacterium]
MYFKFVLFSVFLIACNKTLIKGDAGFTSSQKEMIHSSNRDIPMRVFKITSPKDSILLRTPSTDVIPNPSDQTLELFANRLTATVRDSMSLGVGIAAPQVGILKNIISVQRFDKEGFPFETYLNPKILQYTDLKQPCLEGCLSIPKRRDTTKNRAYAILLDYDLLNGEHKTEMVEDFTAVIFQHEIDHLNGILYIDHLEEHQEKD